MEDGEVWEAACASDLLCGVDVVLYVLWVRVLFLCSKR